MKCANLSEKCVDQVCDNQKNVKESVTSQKDLNLQILHVDEMKMIDMSNVNVVRQEEVITIDKPTLKPNRVINVVK